jgi:mRNA interferase MazF
VLAPAGKGDWILCQVTSKAYGDEKAILITTNDFESGRLRVDSFARPGKLFTAHESLFYGEAGRLHASAFERVRSGVVAVF